MAKHPGISPRGGSKQVRIVAPLDLRDAYGRADFRISLRAMDAATAKA